VDVDIKKLLRYRATSREAAIQLHPESCEVRRLLAEPRSRRLLRSDARESSTGLLPTFHLLYDPLPACWSYPLPLPARTLDALGRGFALPRRWPGLPLGASRLNDDSCQSPSSLLPFFPSYLLHLLGFMSPHSFFSPSFAGTSQEQQPLRT
jgi:hypothetical protein